MFDTELWRIVQPYTLISRERAATLCRLSRDLEWDGVPGDVVECGVFNGGSAALLAYFATRWQRRVWLLDSFQGMPQTTAADGDHAPEYVGQVVGSEALLWQVLDKVEANPALIQVLAGWFEETLPLVTAPQIALLHLDCDWYESVKVCLAALYDRVVPGGFVVLDDYGHWPGCRQAVQEFFGGQMPVLQESDYTGRWFRKA